MPTKKTNQFRNPWVEVNTLEHTLPNGQVSPYTSVRDAGGASIAVLPFRETPDGHIEFLLRAEIVPPWSADLEDPNQLILCALTGVVEEGEHPIQAALRELHEEAGIVAEEERLLPMGSLFRSKVLEGQTFIYTIEATGLPLESPEGDGTGFEAFSHCVWTPDFTTSPDAMVHAMIARMYMLGVILPMGTYPPHQEFYPIEDDPRPGDLSVVRETVDPMTRIKRTPEDG